MTARQATSAAMASRTCLAASSYPKSMAFPVPRPWKRHGFCLSINGIGLRGLASKLLGSLIM
jgi:hypothetical protein